MGIMKEKKCADLLRNPEPDIDGLVYLEQFYQELVKNNQTNSAAWKLYVQEEDADQKSNAGCMDQDDINHDLFQEKQGAFQKKQGAVRALIQAYRGHGHLIANTNPLSDHPAEPMGDLTLAAQGLDASDLSMTFDADGFQGPQKRSLSEIFNNLSKIYCGPIAIEYSHLIDPVERLWVQSQFECLSETYSIHPERKKRLLTCLIRAEGLEKYLGTQYPGAKRFSLEGADSLIVALDTLIEAAAPLGIQEMILCMAHRGRLNVLVNLLGKAPGALCAEFEGQVSTEPLRAGDMKYHSGFSSDIQTASGSTLHLSLAFNPSHLEIVTPVLCGSVKARQHRRSDSQFVQVLPVAIHGDAAFSGQGVVMETLNMSQTRGFKIGGTIHIIVNNQIGFTTSDPTDARSTSACTDIGKMMSIPIIHVNADHPESVYQAMMLAVQYRTHYKIDVIIDLMGYRRQGHSEADEPSVTQPLMYQKIRSLPTALTQYADQLMQEGCLLPQDFEACKKEYRVCLDHKQESIVAVLSDNLTQKTEQSWQEHLLEDWRTPTETQVDWAVLKNLALMQLTLPDGFVLHPIVQKTLNNRQNMAEGLIPCDWGFAENLAYASLLAEKLPVRLSGQDVFRGTFFHRHAVLHDQNNGQEYIPLSSMTDRPEAFSIANSLLSEMAVLAFEYGFSRTEPKGLVIWEAQFGDFANGAQVVIDQFLSSGAEKWGIYCGLTLFLPHGYEGQGAEHSSARIERYLQLCAEGNMQVCVPSTPAQLFHLLRRQARRCMRRPLIVLTPKALLRHPLSVSTCQDFSQGSFNPVLSSRLDAPNTIDAHGLGIQSVSDVSPIADPQKAAVCRRVILCMGKIYYELLEKMRSVNIVDIVIFRMEQLYPFPDCELKKALLPYADVSDIIWCQEEPENQGAWAYLKPLVADCLLSHQSFNVIARPPSAVPATGYLHVYRQQQARLIDSALLQKG